MQRLALLAALLPACFSDPGPQDPSATSTTTGPDPTTTTATTAVTCSDGLKQEPEECDAGPLNGEFAVCRENCKLAFCGDGFAGPDEACDDGDLDDTDSCRNDCTPGRCGDNVLFDEREECDDGNLDDGDACSSKCTNPTCGDGAVDPALGEQCDWGDLNADGAGCTADCRLSKCGDGLLGPAELCDDPLDMTCVDCKPMSCGDTNLDPPEECDDGNTVNTDACLDTCRAPQCGDGVKSPGEECDDGNPFDDDACNTACQQVDCGDGQLVAGEPCDDGNQTPGDGCHNCERDAYFVFVTDQKRKANLGGIATADTYCQEAALTGKLPGTYRAWLSDTIDSPATRFSRASLPYILPGTPSIPVADSWSELVSGALKHPIDRNSLGVQIVADSSCENTDGMVWTHTKATGGPFKDNPCSNWLLDTGNAVAGLLTQSGLSWTEGCPAISCNKALRLYCVEQP